MTDIDLVALSLLRIGSDTRACLAFKERVRWEAVGSSPSRLLAQLADLLRLRSQDQEQARARAARALEAAARHAFHFVSIVEPTYPEALRHIADPPLGLWLRSNSAPCLSAPAVALVGSRNATPAGIMTSRRLARGLAEAGLVVVSGLARGIDEAAHRGALEGKGVTLAVLGSGLDVIYPPEHAPLADEIVGAGAVLAELPPGTRPFARHFPLRNRIISGLARAIVVVEASEKSGSLITARAALEQGRDVLAVPGNIVSGCHRGCHALIKDGARLVERVEDILDEMGWARPAEPSHLLDLALPAHPLWAVMRAGEPVSLDELAVRTGSSVSDLLSEIGQLEVTGRITRVAGGAYVKVD
ncbi:MAG: DNA-processing protein DprA [Vicinamibacterales bacterium]